MDFIERHLGFSPDGWRRFNGSFAHTGFRLVQSPPPNVTSSTKSSCWKQREWSLCTSALGTIVDLSPKSCGSQTTLVQTAFSLERCRDGVLHLTVEDAMDVRISQCPRYGGKLEFRHTVESHRTGAPVDFFRCKDCGHVHAVERTTALEAAAKRKRA